MNKHITRFLPFLSWLEFRRTHDLEELSGTLANEG